jgi:hypothetical protein
MSTYNFDKSSAVTFVAPNTSTPQRGVLLYQSPTLQNGLHSLVIAITNASIKHCWHIHTSATTANESCALVTFRCYVGKRIIEGVVKEKGEAKTKYKEAVPT